VTILRRPSVLPVIHTEFRKLTTVRGPWLLLAAEPLIVIAGVTGLVVSGGNLNDRAVQTMALAHVGLAAILTLVLGILAMAAEYRHRTATDTFLSFPERGRVIAAKLAVHGLVGVIAGLVTSAVAVATAAVWWTAKGAAFPVLTGETWRTVAGGVGVNVAFAVIGVGAGALIRNVVIAVAAALAWIALIEGIAGQLLGAGLARWLPFSASEALGQSDMSAAARLLPQWGGALVLLGYATAIAAAAIVSTLRRDVT
jgi:ABC-2 type transport system permease protein